MEAERSRLGTSTHLLPATRPPAPSVLDQQVARAHLRWAIRVQKVLLRARKRRNLVLGKAGGCFPHRLVGLGVVEVWHPTRGRNPDFPRRLQRKH